MNMNAALLCVGRLKEKYWLDACGEYEKRLSRYGKFEVIQVDDLPEPMPTGKRSWKKRAKACSNTSRPGTM